MPPGSNAAQTAFQLNPPAHGGQAGPPISVVILTLNEQRNIRAALESCAWCDDVHVLDSGSSDDTRRIAAEHGAAVHVHPFSSFGDQRNWAIDHIPTRHTWQFHLDADERFTPALVEEMLREIGPDGTRSRCAGYLIASKLMFRGKWLYHSGGYPTYQVRLLHRARCRFIDFGHGQRESASGEVRTLLSPYLHYNFSKGMVDWFSKHNGYSSRESGEAVDLRRGGPSWKGLWSEDALTRRRTLKNLAFFIRGRAMFRFAYMYLIRGGWLDATAGFYYCAIMSIYEDWIELKVHERELSWPTRTSALARQLLAEGESSP